MRAVHAVLATAAARVFKPYGPDTLLTDAMVNASVQAMGRAAKGIRATPPSVSMLAGHAIKINEWAERALLTYLPEVRPRPSMLIAERAWVSTNRALLQNLDELLIARMANAVVETLGGTVGDLDAVLRIEGEPERLDAVRPNGRVSMTGPAPRLLKTPLDVAIGRGHVIAQDQTGKGAGAASKQVQQAAGVGNYKWITMRDDRVRPSHRRREGRIFSWSKPPPDGHPGEPINCRCFARPVAVVKRSRSGAPGRFRL